MRREPVGTSSYGLAPAAAVGCLMGSGAGSARSLEHHVAVGQQQDVVKQLHNLGRGLQQRDDLGGGRGGGGLLHRHASGLVEVGLRH